MARLITIEDLYQVKFLSRPRISPDSKQVAYVVTTIDGQKHEYRSAIWLSAADGGEARRFTAESAHTGDPTWSPDGRWLAFVSDREGDAADTKQKDQKKQGKGKPQIWLIPTDGGEARQLTSMEHGASSPVWSPDGTQIAFTSNHAEDRWRLPGADIYVLPIVDGKAEELRRLTDETLACSSPSWSPDGRTIALLATYKTKSAGHTFLYKIASDASEQAPTCLSQDFEGTCMDWTNSDIGDEHL